jgi:hypothetical protein
LSNICSGSHRQEWQDQRRPGHRKHVPEIRAHRHHDELHDVAKGAAPLGDAALQNAEILPQQDDVGRVLGDVDRAIDGDADIRSVQRRRVVDPVAEKFDDMSRQMQGFDDSGLLRRRHLGADRDGFEALRQFLVSQFVYLTTEKDIVGQNPNLAADLASDDIVVAGENFDENT